jgi:hypothetical protein
MDEVHEFCRRVLGPGVDAVHAAGEAQAGPRAGRVELLAAAAQACRTRASVNDAPAPEVGDGAGDLAAAVTAEIELATSRLPERHREALALREALRLSHDQIAAVMGLDPAAVAPLLARARLALREERRASPAALAECPDRDRALRALALRQDSEPLGGDDDSWLLAHLRGCAECNQAHAAMYEASVCYRAATLTEPAPQMVNGADGTAPHDAPAPDRAIVARAE